MSVASVQSVQKTDASGSSSVGVARADAFRRGLWTALGAGQGH